MERLLTAINLVADLTLGVIDQDLAQTAFDEHHHESVTAAISTTMPITEMILMEPVLNQFEETTDRVREARRDAAENDDRDAVAQAALGDLLAQPHQEHRAGHQRHDRRQPEHHAWIDHEPGLIFQRDRNTECLEERQNDRQVARVLRDLALPRLRLPSSALRACGDDDRHSCMMIDAEMYGMMPSAKIENR